MDIRLQLSERQLRGPGAIYYNKRSLTLVELLHLM
jgi:hypothetical protein